MRIAAAAGAAVAVAAIALAAGAYVSAQKELKSQIDIAMARTLCRDRYGGPRQPVARPAAGVTAATAPAGSRRT